MPLTDVAICALTKSGSKAGKHFDGGGLYLEVTAQGRCYWRLKYRFAGREKRLALGVYPEVGLKAARAKREEVRALLRDGKDPGAIRAAEKTRAKHHAANTFEARDVGPGGCPRGKCARPVVEAVCAVLPLRACVRPAWRTLRPDLDEGIGHAVDKCKATVYKIA